MVFLLTKLFDQKLENPSKVIIMKFYGFTNWKEGKILLGSYFVLAAFTISNELPPPYTFCK